MSFVNVQPGQDAYERYNVTQTLPIKGAVDVDMGHIYTVDADGYLIKLTATSGAINNANSFYQAKASSVGKTGEADGDRKVQVLSPRSRIALLLPADLTIGDDVEVSSDTSTVSANKVKILGSSGIKLGKIFEILSGNRKSVDEEVGLIEVSF